MMKQPKTRASMPNAILHRRGIKKLTKNTYRVRSFPTRSLEHSKFDTEIDFDACHSIADSIQRMAVLYGCSGRYFKLSAVAFHIILIKSIALEQRENEI